MRVPLIPVTCLCSILPEGLSVPPPSAPTPALAWACPHLDLWQEVDGLWEGHQAVLVQDKLPQLCAPVGTEPGPETGDRGAEELPVLGAGQVGQRPWDPAGEGTVSSEALQRRQAGARGEHLLKAK